jgi:hypothetical protein
MLDALDVVPGDVPVEVSLGVGHKSTMSVPSAASS